MTFIALSLADELKPFNIGVNAIWPVTAIDTQATRHFKMGSEEQWRKPDIVVDATLEVLSREPAKCTGHAYYDEDVLREMGVNDFSKYAVVPGTNPPPFSKLLLK
jgi:citronellol/citronellal dehydrogenase